MNMKKIISFVTLLTIGTTTVSFASIDKNLKYGQRDKEVTELQEFLIDKGLLKTTPSNFFGLLTLKAVKNYQTSIGVSPTGFVGALTREKINKEIESEIASSNEAEKAETSATVTDTVSSKVTTTQPETHFYDEIKPIDYKVNYTVSGQQVLVTFDAPTYYYGGTQQNNNLKCYQGNVELVKIQNIFSFYSSGYGEKVLCKLDYYQPTIKKDVQFKSYAPIDFVKIREMIPYQSSSTSGVGSAGITTTNTSQAVILAPKYEISVGYGQPSVNVSSLENLKYFKLTIVVKPIGIPTAPLGCDNSTIVINKTKPSNDGFGKCEGTSSGYSVFIYQGTLASGVYSFSVESPQYNVTKTVEITVN